MVSNVSTAINLDTPVEQPTISIDDGVNASPNLSPSQVNDRATRTHFALSNTLPNKTYDDVHKDIANGQENKLRTEAASSEDSKKAQGVWNAATKGLPLKVEDLPQKQTNPDTVVEDRYGAQHMRFLNWPMHDADNPHPLKDAILSDPNHADQVAGLGGRLIAKNAIIDRFIEDNQAVQDQQSKIGYGLDFAKSLVPFYSEAKLREHFNNLFGQELDKQGQDLYSIPDLDEFSAKIKDKYQALEKDNPQLAGMWLRAIRGQSSGEKVLNNVGTIFDTSTVAAPVVRVLGLRNLVTNTTRGIVKATEAAAEQTPAVAASAAAGDLSTAGRLKATATIAHSVTDTGNPVQDVMQQWPSVLKKTADDLGKNPGNFGQEATNRMVERYNELTSKLEKGLANTVHIETNSFIPTEENMKLLQTEMKERYKFENTLNIGEPIFNETTKTHDVPIHLGTSNAEYFPSAEAAKRLAETKGLLDHEIVPVSGSPDAPSSDVVRFYHGGNNPTSGGSRWLTPSSEYARNYGEGNREIHYVDIPRKDLESKYSSGYDEINKYPRNFEAPEQLAKQLRPYNAGLSGANASQANALKKTIDAQARELSAITRAGKDEDLPQSLIDRKTQMLASFKDNVEKLKGITEGSSGPVYIRITRPFPKNASFIKDLIGTTKDTEVQNSWLNAAIGWARTPEDTQSIREMQNRKVIEYAPSIVKSFYKEVATPLRTVIKGKNGKEALQSFERIIDHVEKTGQWWKDPLELEGMYQKFMGRLPSNAETEAHIAYKYARQVELSLRQNMAYRAAHDKGAVSLRLFQIHADGTRDNSPYFNAVRRDHIPADSGGVYQAADKIGGDSVFNKGQDIPQDLHEAVKKGEREVYEIHEPSDHPLNGFGKVTASHNHRIRYIVTGKNKETKNLSFNQIPEGQSLREPDYAWHAVQADIQKEGEGKNAWRWLEGEKSLLGHDIRLQAQDLADSYNAVRELIKGNNHDAAEQLFTAKGLHGISEWKDFKARFEQGRDGKGKFQRPFFNVDEPFMVVPRDRLAMEMPGNGIAERNGLHQGLFKDATKEGSIKKQSHTELLKNRDTSGILSPKNTGTRMNPVYSAEPLRYVDPMTTMDRAMNSTINSMFMDDYKSTAMTELLERARPYLNNPTEARTAPAWTYRNLENSLKTGTDISIKRQLLNQKFQIDQFVGMPSWIEQFTHSWSQSLADSIYSKWNPDHYGPITRSLLLTPPWLLSHLSDPLAFVRSFAFSATMGFFNPVHLFIWSMNYATIFGISGVSKALPGTLGAVLHQMSRFNKNPAILDHLDKIASRMGGFKPGQWQEAMQGMERTGFGMMMHEISMLPHELSPKVYESGYRRFMDFGQLFMKGADRNMRYGAWYTAYKEFRDTVPTGALSNKDWLSILNRADMLAGNMSNASRSALQKGVMSWPTQFLSYQLRLWEMMTGKRLTTVEKGRLLTTYGVLFGIPGAAGLASSPFIPAGESLRQAAIDHGYITGDGVGVTSMMEGFLGHMSKLITGEYQNVGERFGAYGAEEGLRDKTMWDIAGGAAYSKMANVWASSSGFWNMVQSFVRGDGEFHPEAEHFLAIAENLNSIHSINRAALALTTGKWLSINGTTLYGSGQVGDPKVSPSEAVVSSVMGLTRTSLQNSFSELNSIQGIKNNQKIAEREFTKEYRLGLQALHNKDPEQSKKYFQNARYYLEAAGYPHELIPEVMRRASEDWISTIVRSNWDYYSLNRNIPTTQQQARHDQFTQLGKQ